MKCRTNNIGTSTIEYMVMITLILGALYVMVPVISNAINGRWKSSGDSFGMGRQYQHNKSVDCAYTQITADSGIWYDQTCYYQRAASECTPQKSADIKLCEKEAMEACKQAFCNE